jgi:phospholipid/cholesterol/gamma-HCH transport system ATP-binding protein
MSIELKDVHKSLGGRPVLKGVDLVAPSDSITFIIGPSGAGKSVTARHAAGLLRPDSGRVLVFGERVDTMAEPALAQLRRQCAFVLQGAALLDGLDLLENVALGARAAGAARRQALSAATDLLARVGLTDVGRHMPSEVGPGVLMRTAIARALALTPKMIIYDEPTSGLDPAAARRLDALILAMRREGLGALIISHDLTSIMTIADTIHLLHDGRIYLSGPPRTFRESTDPVVRQFMDGKPEGPLPDW